MADVFKSSPCPVCGCRVRYNHLHRQKCVTCTTTRARERYKEPLTPAMKVKAVQMYKDGVTPSQIAHRIKRRVAIVRAELFKLLSGNDDQCTQ